MLTEVSVEYTWFMKYHLLELNNNSLLSIVKSAGILPPILQSGGAIAPSAPRLSAPVILLIQHKYKLERACMV